MRLVRVRNLLWSGLAFEIKRSFFCLNNFMSSFGSKNDVFDNSMK